jgi:hypothetical protein
MAGSVCVYAVVPSDTAAKKLAAVDGIEGAPLELIRDGAIAAVASPIRTGRLRPTRAALTAHENVTTLAHRLGPALPVRFGTLFPDNEAVVRDLLAVNRDHLEALMQDLKGRDEYRLRARYLSNVALTEVVSRNRQVQRLRDRLNGRPAGPAAQIQLGELVVAGLEALREEDADAVMKHIAPFMVAGQRLPDRAEDTAVHLALLVDRDRAEELEKAVEKLGAAHRGRLHLELIGPLAPWDFTTLATGAA